MHTYVLNRAVRTVVEPTANVMAVAEMFGLGQRGEQEMVLLDQCKVTIASGPVVYVTGGSGTGKSTVLAELKKVMDPFVDLDRFDQMCDKAVVDCFDAPLSETLKWLSLAGLSDAHALLRRPAQLSDGQRYRLCLARALAEQPEVIFIDECCATLDRVTAVIVAHNIRKFADTYQTTFIVATSHDDLLEALCPDVIILKHFGSHTEVFYPQR